MPEGPELRLAAEFINKVSKDRLFGGKVVKSDVSTKNPSVDFQVDNYRISAVSRGKELKVFLSDVEHPEQNSTFLLFRFGMSGCFKLTKSQELPKHAHLRFFTSDRQQVLCFVDYRRFGSWHIEKDWGPDRGPDPMTEYEEFRKNVLENLNKSCFNKPICEVMLDQKYFNGIGNYLRAEILYRCQVAPFTKAKDVLESLTAVKQEHVKHDLNDLLLLCHVVPKEVLCLGGGKGYDVEHDAEEEKAFSDWLQCYYKDGMNNLVDCNGRTIWFKGDAGPMRPKNAKTRGKKKQAKGTKEEKIDIKTEIKDLPTTKRKTNAIKTVNLEKRSPKKLRSGRTVAVNNQ